MQIVIVAVSRLPIALYQCQHEIARRRKGSACSVWTRLFAAAGLLLCGVTFPVFGAAIFLSASLLKEHAQATVGNSPILRRKCVDNVLFGNMIPLRPARCLGI